MKEGRGELTVKRVCSRGNSRSSLLTTLSPVFLSKISISQAWRSRDHSQGLCGAADDETARSDRFKRLAGISITDVPAPAALLFLHDKQLQAIGPELRKLHLHPKTCASMILYPW
jgi:hypothetical protein